MTTRSTAFVIIMLVSSGLSAHAQETEFSWSAFTGGFGEVTDGNTVAQLVTGQPFIGEFEGPDISVGGGFLYNPVVTGLQTSVTIALQQGWNMVSNPVTREAGDDSVRNLFPASVYPHGFAYIPGEGYGQRFTLENRVGYWVKFPDVGNTGVFGLPRYSDTIAVARGWNMVGSISVPVDTGAIISDPPGNRISPWFGYFGALTAVDQILPGYAYWVKAETTGVFILGSPIISGERPARSLIQERAVQQR